MESHSHDAQPCYCGEANCVGFLGGKTQTDVAAMDDLYLDGRYLMLTSLIVVLTHIQRSVLLMSGNHKDSRVRGRRRARNSTKITSRLSDLSLTRRFRKSFKLFDNRKAEKYYSSYLPVSRCAPKMVFTSVVSDPFAQITVTQSPLRQLMRLRGYSLMCNILEDNADDVELCTNVRFELS